MYFQPQRGYMFVENSTQWNINNDKPIAPIELFNIKPKQPRNSCWEAHHGYHSPSATQFFLAIAAIKLKKIVALQHGASK